jgi:DnaJ family protein C protein 2
MVEQAFSLDPRIKKFRQEEKLAKEAKKNEKLAAQKAAEEEARLKAQKEAEEKAAQEALEKEKAAQEKKEREAAKNANRKEKKAIKRIVRDNNNFLPADATAAAIAYQLTKLDEILNVYETEQLASFRSKMEEVLSLGMEALNLVLDEEHLLVQESLDAAKKESADKLAKSKEASTDDSAKAPWSPKEAATLIKAVKLFPGGTLDRWTKIAEYVIEHSADEGQPKVTRTPKECIAFSKTVQRAAAADRAKLQESVQKPVTKVEIKEQPTEKVEESATPKETPVASPAAPESSTSMKAPANPNWNTEQQTALENALRQFPAASFREAPNQRWVKIAEVIPGKTVKEIKARVKELVEFAKTKKK